MSAQLSAQYSMAVALKLGGGGKAEFIGGLTKDVVLALAQRCHSGIHPIWATYSRTAMLEAAADREGTTPIRVPLKSRAANRRTPLTAGEVQARFRSLVAGVLEDTAAEQIWRLVSTTCPDAPGRWTCSS